MNYTEETKVALRRYRVTVESWKRYHAPIESICDAESIASLALRLEENGWDILSIVEMGKEAKV
jgi:hypothetical protein